MSLRTKIQKMLLRLRPKAISPTKIIAVVFAAIILVGTLLEVGRGYWDVDYVQTILDAKDRKLAGPTAPPEGLCLMKVDY